MAKLALIFLAVFCLFQLTIAGRIAREEPKKVDEGQKILQDVISSVDSFFEQNFSKDKLDKMGENLKSFGEQITARGKELLQQADENIKKLQTKE